MANDNIIIDNVLCYMTCALNNNINTNTIISACLSFYDEMSIQNSRKVPDEKTNCRNLRPRSEDPIYEDIKYIISRLEHCILNDVTLPKFVAFGCNALPVENFYKTAYEIGNLRSEIKDLINEMKMLKSSVLDYLTDGDSLQIKDDINEIKKFVANLKDNEQKNISAENVETDFLDQSDKQCFPKIISSHNPESNSDVISVSPSAPTLSQFSNFDIHNVTPTSNGHVGTALYSSKVKSIVKSFEISPKTSSVKTSKVIVKSPNRPAYEPRIKKYSEGFPAVFSRSRGRSVIVGSRKTAPGPLKGAARTFDLYLGRCDPDVTEQDIYDYSDGELGIKLLKCVKLDTRIPFSKAFKITVDFAKKDKLLDDMSWPEGVICRRFYVNRSKY